MRMEVILLMSVTMPLREELKLFVITLYLQTLITCANSCNSRIMRCGVAPPYMDALKNSLASSGQSYGYEYPGLGLEMLISKLAECRRIYDESNKINELTKSIREFVDHFSIQHESFKDSFKKYLCSVDTYVDGDYTDNEIVNKLLKYTKDEFDSFLSEHGHEVGDEIEDDEADAFITSRIDELKEGWGLTQLEEEISRLEK